MSKEAMKLRTAAEKVVEICSERPLSLGKWFIDMSEACESLREALAEQPAQQEPWPENPAAPVQQEVCPTCGEYEPRTGTCGTSPNDKRALCNRNAPQPAQQQEPVAFSQFLSDVVTAAGLLSHGKTDKSLAARISEFAFRLRTSPQPAQQEPDYKALYEKASQQYNELAALMEQPPAQPEPVQDAEGENKAVRCFLMLYGQAGLTVGQMRKHMAMSGFKSWPTWVETEHDGAHLTKAGAQLWIRHLFALDATPPAAPVQEPEIDGATIAGMDASIGHLSALVDELRLLLGCAMDNFKMLHNAAKPDDGPDMDAIIPAIVFAKFVNQDAALRYAIKHSAHDGMITAPPAAQPAPVQEAGARVDAVVAKIKAGIAEKPTALNSYGLKLWDSVRDDLLALATPPAAQRQWVGLTDEDIEIAFDDTQEGGGFNEFARAIEAKLKEKNT